MGLLLALLIGAAVGAVVGSFLLRNAEFLLLNILVGIVGAILGLGFAYFILPAREASSFINWPGVVCSIIGALVALLLFDLLHRIMPKRIDHITHSGEEGSPDSEED